MPTIVRQAINDIEKQGWVLVRTRGSHRQCRHLERLSVKLLSVQPEILAYRVLTSA